MWSLRGWLRERRERRAARFQIDDLGVRQQLAGTVAEVKWEELEAIDIVTTDEGPFVEDVFWVFHGRQGGCVIPGELGSRILDFANRFPDWDTSAVVTAMGSTGNARFRVWTRGKVTDNQAAAP